MPVPSPVPSDPALAAVTVLDGAPPAASGRTRRRKVDVLFWIAMAWLALVVLAAVLAPLLPLGNYQDATKALSSPTFAPPRLGSAHWLGTNQYGLDELARTIYGARTSLTIAVFAALLGTVIGGLIGILAGFLRGPVDSVTGILANALLAVPPLILLIALGTVLTPNVRNIAFALALLTIPSMVRVARANTIAFAQRDFVTAARAMGATRGRLMMRELLPNVVPSLLSLAVVMISMLVIAEASLSFLGLGIKPPDPTWGNMIAEGQQGIMQQHPFIVVVPGICLLLTVFAMNLLGEKVQKRWNPKGGNL